MNVAAAIAAVMLAGAPGVESLVNAKDSLGGLNGFSVVVDVDDTSRQAGVTGRSLAAHVEGVLRKRGLHVYRYSGNRVVNDPGTPGKEGQLKIELVSVSGAAAGEIVIALRYDLAISQWARLETDPSAATFARTWMQGGVVIAPAARAPEVVRAALAPTLDAFCSDYGSARAVWLANHFARTAAPKDR